MIPENMSVNELVDAYKSTGDSDAFSFLLSELEGVISFKVTAAINSLPYRSDMREELVASAYECLLATIRTFDSEKASFKTYYGSALDRHLLKSGSRAINTIRISSSWVAQYRIACGILAENPELSDSEVKERLRLNALERALVRFDGDSEAAEDWLVKSGTLVAIENVRNTERLLNLQGLESAEYSAEFVALESPLEEDVLPAEECKKILENPVMHTGFSGILVERVETTPLKLKDLLSEVRSGKIL